MAPQLRREDYTVGWVCALSEELAAAKALLDEEHEDFTRDSEDDGNVYCTGSIAGHNVVIVCLPAGHIGTNPAATVVTQMRAAFKGIRFGLMVGIGGGVPGAEADIRLGDVVVSKPYLTFGGVVQYDMGKATTCGFERTGSLNSPPQILLSAINTVKANEMLGRSKLSDYISKLESISSFQRCMAGPDVLFEADYDHVGGHTCEQCDASRQQTRSQRKSKGVLVHYGTIASGNQVIRSAAERDKVSSKLGGVLCFEMEAAGLMNSFPCLVIRGICDYADSHKNKQWQTYAAGTAAGYAKEVLSAIPAKQVMESHPAEETMRRAGEPSLISRSLQSAPFKRRRIEISSNLETPIVEQQIVPLSISRQNLCQTSMNEEQKRALLESLRFDQIDARQTNIRNTHAKTCRWLLKHAEYRDWLDITQLGKHHGFLWIKGKPGSGKSTLMKFALINARKTMKDRTVLSFFFNARGEDLEKSTVGAYRSLLLQLLERFTELQSSVFDSLRRSAANFNTDQQWNVESLKTLLEQAIKTLKESSVVCFIDALDECEEEQVRDMIQFFEHIGDLAVSDGICFLVCFSSRHYPHITIRKGLELVLEGQEGHGQDITNYVERELKIGMSKTAQLVRAELQEKASGIFMWVVLVVGILNKQWDRGRIHELRQKLREIPSNLHELFRDILIRGSHNECSLVLCIQWVLFAKQPLTPEQLYHAILSGIKLNAVSEWDNEEHSKDVIRRFILDSSKGLTEVTVSKVPKVQFIHESVRDFLLKENGLGEIWPGLGSNFQDQSHERLKQCCFDYMNLVDVATLGISDDLSKASSPAATGMNQSAIERFPFLEYAVHNVLYHADAAEGGGISQMTFLDSFSRSQWVTLDNLFEKHKVRRHKERVSLLYILAELNMANLIVAHSSGGQCLEVEDERYGCPLFAAIATRSKEAAQACIEGLKPNQATSSNDRGRYEEYFEEEIVQNSLGREFKYSRRRGMLLYVVEFGHEPIVKLLLEKDADVNAQGGKYGSALHAASSRGHEPIVKLLLKKGANVNARSRPYDSVLHAASFGGHEPIVKLLLEKGADINAQCGHYGSALHVASSGGHEPIIKLLLEKGADINAQGGLYGNALQVASSGGHEPIIKLLLEKGADINAQGGLYGSALQAASSGGYEPIIKLLLEKGADINAQGGLYGNALQAASSRGREPIVKLLLEKGAL